MSKKDSHNFVLTLRLLTQIYQENILDKRFEIARLIYNDCLREFYKMYKLMRESKRYQAIIKMEKSKERTKELYKISNDFGFTKYLTYDFCKPFYKHFKKNIDSNTARSTAQRCYSSFKKKLYNPSTNVKFKKYGNYNSIQGLDNASGIKYRNQSLKWNGLNIPIIIGKKDEYAIEALKNKIKYCRIIRKTIRGKKKYYIQLNLEGTPPSKGRENVNNKVGLDIGMSTIAIVSNEKVKLLELGPDLDDLEKEKRILKRKLDRQRRANNSDNYNEDGTVKEKLNLNWVESNNYIKTKNKLKEVIRKQKYLRKKAHEELANYILSLGNEIYVEKMNFKGLQRKAKNTTINKKTGKYSSKKRFGKSIANKAPGLLIKIINRKLSYQDKE